MNELDVFEAGSNDLDGIETNDAMLRYTEGGGPVPAQMHSSMTGFQGLGQTGASGPWYKSPTFLAIAAVAIAAVAFTLYSASKGKGDSETVE
jgi:hypothetical protein